MADTSPPTISGTVRQSFLVEPLTGPKDTFYYLEGFPDEIYHKSPDTHLYKFMRILLGEAGVGAVRKNLLEARIKLEELGVDMFDLDAFYGSPFAFGRIAEETIDINPDDLIDRDKWEEIQAKNAKYRNRALDYVNGARAGNTPHGMRLVAKAGLGHDVEIVENYKYLFDVHLDDPLGLTYYGRTISTEEMIILPRPEVGISEQQVLQITGEPNSPNMGDFYFIYNGLQSVGYPYTYDDGGGPVVKTTIPFDGTADHIRLALEAIPTIGEGNVDVTGGPGPDNPWLILFTGALSNLDVPRLDVISTMGFATSPPDPLTIQPGNPIVASIYTLQGGRELTDQEIHFSEKEKYSLQQAIDHIRAQTTIPTIGTAKGTRERISWNNSYASSEYSEVVRYVTGLSNIKWNLIDPNGWIVATEEIQAPRVYNDLQYNYSGFQNITTVEPSSTLLLPEGNIDPQSALADYAEPLFITSVGQNSAPFINGIYPISYTSLPGTPNIQYSEEFFWASLERADDEYLILNLAQIAAANYISFDVNLQALNIDLFYDAQDGTENPQWIGVQPIEPYNNMLIPNSNVTQNPWASIGLTFSDPLGNIIYTRLLKVQFTRKQNYTGIVSVKNLRIARNI